MIGGARIDRFDESALDMNTNINRSLVNTNVSPQAAVIVKPMPNFSIYGTYSVSYLPASGDQFSALADGTIILSPQKFVNEEIGVKWNINPRLLYTAAVMTSNDTMFLCQTRTTRDFSSCLGETAFMASRRR